MTGNHLCGGVFINPNNAIFFEGFFLVTFVKNVKESTEGLKMQVSKLTIILFLKKAYSKQMFQQK